MPALNTVGVQAVEEMVCCFCAIWHAGQSCCIKIADNIVAALWGQLLMDTFCDDALLLFG